MASGCCRQPVTYHRKSCVGIGSFVVVVVVIVVIVVAGFFICYVKSCMCPKHGKAYAVIVHVVVEPVKKRKSCC